jgi:hypothetical protein
MRETSQDTDLPRGGWRVILRQMRGLFCETGSAKGYPEVSAAGLDLDASD